MRIAPAGTATADRRSDDGRAPGAACAEYAGGIGLVAAGVSLGDVAAVGTWRIRSGRDAPRSPARARPAGNTPGTRQDTEQHHPNTRTPCHQQPKHNHDRQRQTRRAHCAAHSALEPCDRGVALICQSYKQRCECASGRLEAGVRSPPVGCEHSVEPRGEPRGECPGVSLKPARPPARPAGPGPAARAGRRDAEVSTRSREAARLAKGLWTWWDLPAGGVEVCWSAGWLRDGYGCVEGHPE